MSDDISIPSPTYRVPRRRHGMDPATRKLAVIAAAIGGGLIVLVGGWNLVGHRSHGVPVVQADTSPLRVKPDNPGGMQVAGASNDIFSGGSDTDVHKLAPPPETPNPQALQAQVPNKPTVATSAASAPPATSAVSPIASAAPPAAVPVPVSAAAPPPAAIVAPAPRPSAAVATPAPSPSTAIATPAPRPSAAVAPPARPAEKPATSSVPAHAAAAKGPQVQLAALKSEQAAQEEWDRMAKRWPDLLGGRKPAFSKVEHDGQVFWRVRTSGFDGLSQATIFCERLRAKGAGCSVADF